jgi:hypothetical protein
MFETIKFLLHNMVESFSGPLIFKLYGIAAEHDFTEIASRKYRVSIINLISFI